ncbi:MAG: hypothetical protein F6K62_10520 [Sphaerospermopsis sp. SIO1G2]|nr:hypothetical protein [Sphaerospermopsis sp. SIO1G2]
MRALFFTTCLLLLPAQLSAGAWVQPKGQTQNIVTYRYYETDEFFDLSGDERDKNGRYTKHEIQYYAEYGWRDTITLGTSLFMADETDTQRFISRDPFTGALAEQERVLELQGLHRSDIFLRYQLYRDDVYAVAIQPLLTLPAAYTGGVPRQVVEEDGALELGIMGGRNFTWLGRTHYVDTRLAYRQRFHADDQILMEALAGFRVANRWTVMPELQYTAAVGGVDSRLTTIAGQNNYDLLKLQISALYQVNDKFGIQAGVFTHADGVNTGGGGGALLSLWLQF